MATSVPATSVPAKLVGKGRAWAWTLNNYTEDDINKLREYAKKNARYMVWGYEVAPTTGTPHLQGYVAFDNPRSYQKFKDDTTKTISLTIPTVGTAIQNRQYCLKIRPQDDKPNEKFEEFGEVPRQGERTDWCVAVEEIKTGTPVEQVIENQPQLLPCIRALETFKSRLLKPLNRDITVIVLWGDAGSGKSRYAYDNFPGLYSKPPGKWWDGYTGQDTILLDDYYGYIPYTELLNVLDRYAYHAEIKGGYVWAQWTTVIITSNKPPEKWYSVGLTPALRRRINKIFFYSINAPPSPYEPPPRPQASSWIEEA